MKGSIFGVVALMSMLALTPLILPTEETDATGDIVLTILEPIGGILGVVAFMAAMALLVAFLYNNTN